MVSMKSGSRYRPNTASKTSATTSHAKARCQIGRRWGLVVALVLLAVFGLYLDPDFMLTIAEQTWACF